MAAAVQGFSASKLNKPDSVMGITGRELPNVAKCTPG